MTNKINIRTDIQDKRWKKAVDFLPHLIDQCQKTALSVILSDVPFLNEPKKFFINLALSNDQTVHQLNKEFRGMDKPTNVLSFANIDDEFFPQMLQTQSDIELGDIILAFETMAREASELEIGLEEHFCHLFVHGILHILGYDHIKRADRLRMEQAEIKILNLLGYQNPYQE